MKFSLALILVLSGFFSSGYGQQNDKWDKWNWLIGEWKGEGSGKPGEGSGTFTFAFDLDKKVIIRKSHSEYPAPDTKLMTTHDDLMIVYLNYSGNPDKAIYFDNEGHTISYHIVYSDKSIVMTSDKIPHVPLFRLTYFLLDDGTVNTKFEMSQDGDKFITYIEGISSKVN